MRPIKFKAKRLSDSKWVEGGIYEENGTFSIRRKTDFPNNVYFSYLVESETICQFTGLVDIDREEVYEHDIIMTEICLMVVVYVATSASFGAIPLNQFNELNDKANISTDNMYWFDNDIVDFGIYGNIHDKNNKL